MLLGFAFAAFRDVEREALQLLETSGKSARQLERELGIGKTCLSRWKRELEAKGKQAFGTTHLVR